MNVLKFGGSSVGNVQSIQQVLQAIKNEYQKQPKIVVVCSAMSGITNLLLGMASAAANGQEFLPALKEMEKRHYEVVRILLESKLQNEVLIGLKIYFNELEDILFGVAALGEASDRTKDRIAVYGELCSNFMMSHLVNQYVSKSIFVDARPLIVTDNSYGNARVNFEQTNPRLQHWYSTLGNEIPMVTGFIGATKEGIPTTLGRGGGDYSPAIIAAALHANEVQIWTDVDGFMTADPRIVKQALSLPELSYAEAMELSFFGAKVIYPPTLVPAVQQQIPIIIKNTFNLSYAGSYIHAIKSQSNGVARGIASMNEVCLVNMEGGGLVGFKDFSGRLFGALASKNVNVIMIAQASSEHSLTFVIKPDEVAAAELAISQEFEYELLTGKIENFTIEKELSIVAVVGENMRYAKGLAGKVFHSLGRVGINITAIAQGASERNISAVIKKKDLPKALNTIHNALFLSNTRNAYLVVVGTGNIGKTLLKQIAAQQKHLEEKQQLSIKLVGLSNSRHKLLNTAGIDFNNWETSLQSSTYTATFSEFIEAVKQLNLPNIIFVDNTGSQEVSSYYNTLLENNISVVTCNKIANSSQQNNYNQLRQFALKQNVDFLYETNVGAGLPIIKTLQDLVHSGDSIVKIEAILSGTISFIFNNYKNDTSFVEIVKDAQNKGFTEPNPADDLSGKDFARKMLILAREIGYQLELEDVIIQSILPEVCLQATNVQDFYANLPLAEASLDKLKQEAAQTNCVLRYIGIIENNRAEVKLQLVNAQHPFYSLSGSDNIISITTQRYLHNPLVVKGPGAGAEVTAAGVFGDIMRAASSL